jgi:hypothetical protein
MGRRCHGRHALPLMVGEDLGAQEATKSGLLSNLLGSLRLVSIFSYSYGRRSGGATAYKQYHRTRRESSCVLDKLA